MSPAFTQGIDSGFNHIRRSVKVRLADFEVNNFLADFSRARALFRTSKAVSVPSRDMR